MQSIPDIKDTDIVPESYQMRLMAWRDEFTRGYFEIGDMANEIILLNIQSNMKVENAIIYSAIGRFCGKSGRTVRDYAEISAFFPQHTRDEYDMLPFSHFRFAKSCGLKWQNVLDYSLDHPDASEERLSHQFSSADVAAPILSVAALVASGVAPDVAASVAAPVAAGLSGIYVLANLISQAESMLSWELKKETRRKLILALDGLKDVLRELSEKEPSLKYDYDTEESPHYWTA
jgi:hypothetical protein